MKTINAEAGYQVKGVQNLWRAPILQRLYFVGLLTRGWGKGHHCISYRLRQSQHQRLVSSSTKGVKCLDQDDTKFLGQKYIKSCPQNEWTE